MKSLENMWKTIANSLIHTKVKPLHILKPENVIQEQIRVSRTFFKVICLTKNTFF